MCLTMHMIIPKDVLTNKYYKGIVPAPANFSEVDEDVLAAVKEFPNVIGKSIERYRFREASQELMNLARLGNKYLADEEPWKVIKLDEERVQTIMYVALQISAALSVLSKPFLPFTSDTLQSILNIDENLLINSKILSHLDNENSNLVNRKRIEKNSEIFSIKNREYTFLAYSCA